MNKFAIVVPARKNSRGLKNKNVIKINNLRLIEYTFRTIKNINLPKYVITDSKLIKLISKKYKINNEFLRSKSTSRSNSTLSETLKPFCEWLKKKNNNINTLIILQCTSPLTNSKDILKAIKDFNEKNLNSLFSISESFEHPYETVNLKKNNWNYNFKEVQEFRGRQEYRINSYFINGSIFISKISNILKKNSIISKKHGYTIMPKSRSLDIDDKANMDRFQLLSKNNN